MHFTFEKFIADHYSEVDRISRKHKLEFKAKGVKNSGNTCYAACVAHMFGSIVDNLNHLTLPINPANDKEKEELAQFTDCNNFLIDYNSNNIIYINNFRPGLLR